MQQTRHKSEQVLRRDIRKDSLFRAMSLTHSVSETSLICVVPSATITRREAKLLDRRQTDHNSCKSALPLPETFEALP
jgi:hypothetical protein